MKLTISEAENILSRVFSQEIGNGKVEIESTGDAENMIRHTNSDYYISRETLIRMLKAMGRQGLKIEAIKLYREIVPGTGLADAKSYIENLMGTP